MTKDKWIVYVQEEYSKKDASIIAQKLMKNINLNFGIKKIEKKGES